MSIPSMGATTSVWRSNFPIMTWDHKTMYMHMHLYSYIDGNMYIFISIFDVMYIWLLYTLGCWCPRLQYKTSSAVKHGSLQRPQPLLPSPSRSSTLGSAGTWAVLPFQWYLANPIKLWLISASGLCCEHPYSSRISYDKSILQALHCQESLAIRSYPSQHGSCAPKGRNPQRAMVTHVPATYTQYDHPVGVSITNHPRSASISPYESA